MSAIDSREQLIQQRHAEKYINVIRMVLLALLTLALLVRDAGLVSDVPIVNGWPAFMLTVAWVYALLVHGALSRGFFPRYLPVATVVVDLFFITTGFVVSMTLSRWTFPEITNNLGWGYGLLILFILFSTLRERPVLTLVSGIACTVVYCSVLLYYFTLEPFRGFWLDQWFRMGLLLMAGGISSFHARSIRKAFAKVAASERMRRETDARLKVLALHFPGVLFQAEVVDQVFQLRYVSEGSRELLGFGAPELLADPSLFFAKAQPGLGEILWARINQAGGTYRTWDEEFRYNWPNGRSGWLKMSVTTHQPPRGGLVVNGLISDVSEQRRTAEALREANQAKTDFLATMSHELRTPLNAILGNSDHLARLADLDDDKKAFRDIQASGETLLGLIEDILVFSRLEAGRLTAEVRPFTWKSQLDLALDTYRPQAAAKGLTLSAKYPSGAPTWIWTDVLRLRQIVGNLVGNAVKFTPSGSVVVQVSFEPGDQSPWFVLEVTDTGIGIPAGSIDRIFDKFTQGEHGKSRTYGGLGLGLSISRSLAALLGGTLEVTSRQGMGSTFTLRIPVRTGDSPGELPAGSEDIQGVKRAARVLLVEDNQTNQDVATRMLKKLGVQVDLAPGGREAVALATQKYYDLIFMDWQMPVMDGREATAKIRALPGGQDLVIVALSGHALPGDRELLLASGFDDYLSKPVRMDDFRATLAKWVNLPRDPG